MLLEEEMLGAIAGEATSGSRVMDIVGDDTSRMEVTIAPVLTWYLLHTTSVRYYRG